MVSSGGEAPSGDGQAGAETNTERRHHPRGDGCFEGRCCDSGRRVLGLAMIAIACWIGGCTGQGQKTGGSSDDALTMPTDSPAASSAPEASANSNDASISGTSTDANIA